MSSNDGEKHLLRCSKTNTKRDYQFQQKTTWSVFCYIDVFGLWKEGQTWANLSEKVIKWNDFSTMKNSLVSCLWNIYWLNEFISTSQHATT